MNCFRTLIVSGMLLATSASIFAQQAKVFTTDGSRTYSLTQTNIQGEATSDINTIAQSVVLRPAIQNQTIDGFGFAITYSSCYNLLKMSPEARTKLLKQTFSMTEGYGVSYARISIGCNDFSSTEYSLCDTRGYGEDKTEHFRLYTDETDYVIPVLKEILAINPDLKIIAAPWTCPRWMKVQSLTNLTAKYSWTDGHLNPNMRKDYAQYFVKFVKAFEQEGIRIHAVCPQNEPLNPGNCASLYMPWQEEADFVRELAPAFHNANINTQIYLFDHNYNYDGKSEEQQYPVKIYNYLKDYEFDGKDLVVGAAYHNYGGNSDELNVIHNAYPNKLLMFTEASIGTWNDGRNLDTSLADNMVNVGLNTVNKHCIAALVWNYMLDMNRGPNLDGGCQTCYGAIDIANDYQSYTYNSHFYTIAHMSLAARPGAVRINTTGRSLSGVTHSAFLNPDGTTSIVFYNSNQSDINASVYDGTTYIYKVYLPARAAVTVVMGQSGLTITENPKLNDEEMRETGPENYRYTGQLTQGEKYTVTGRDEPATDSWYSDPDFFSPAGNGSFTFKPFTGNYVVDANFSQKNFKVTPLNENGERLTYDTQTGTGCIWVIGNDGMGKPTYAQAGNWGASNGWSPTPDMFLAMPQVGDHLFQFTLTVGEQLRATNVNFKFFHQAGYGSDSVDEFNATGPCRITTDSDIFMIDTSENGNIKLRSGKTLQNGTTYVFTLDCSDPNNAKLTVTDAASTGIKDVQTASDSEASAPVYDLNGRRVQAPRKGIYIRQGKKIAKQ